MENFDLKKYLAEGKINEARKVYQEAIHANANNAQAIQSLQQQLSRLR